MWLFSKATATVEQMRELLKEQQSAYAEAGILTYHWHTSDGQSRGVRAVFVTPFKRVAYESMIAIPGRTELGLMARTLWELDNAARIVTGLALLGDCSGR